MIPKRTLSLMTLAAIAVLASPPTPADPALTVRDTPLRDAPRTDAAELKRLPADTPLTIEHRQGAWYQVRGEAGLAGWVPMLSLRLAGEARRGRDLGLGALANTVSTGRSGAASTTGVRGLDEESLRNADADPAAVTRLESYAAGEATAREFAAAEGLSSIKVRYTKQDRREDGR